MSRQASTHDIPEIFDFNRLCQYLGIDQFPYKDFHFEKIENGYHVESTFNPSAIQVIYDEQHNLLTGNGPQSIDVQAEKLEEVLNR